MQKMFTLKDVERLARINAQKALASMDLSEQICGRAIPSQQELNRRLHEAVKSGTLKEVELALDAKAEPNSCLDGWTPLGRALLLNRKNVASLLGRHGAVEVNQSVPSAKTHDTVRLG